VARVEARPGADSRLPLTAGTVAVAGTIVPTAYIAWSVWLIALGVGLLVS
jgi:hypothetical protein